jgi:hypothetical protein
MVHAPDKQETLIALELDNEFPVYQLQAIEAYNSSRRAILDFQIT